MPGLSAGCGSSPMISSYSARLVCGVRQLPDGFQLFIRPRRVCGGVSWLDVSFYWRTCWHETGPKASATWPVIVASRAPGCFGNALRRPLQKTSTGTPMGSRCLLAVRATRQRGFRTACVSKASIGRPTQGKTAAPPASLFGSSRWCWCFRLWF